MDDNKSLLRLGLNTNAAFSLATGLLLALLPGVVGGWLGVDIDLWLRLLGFALIGHFGALVFISRQVRPHALAKVNLLMIAPYPLLMIGLVVTGLVDRNLGQVLVLLDGAVVGAVAFLQRKGLRGTLTKAETTLV